MIKECNDCGAVFPDSARKDKQMCNNKCRQNWRRWKEKHRKVFLLSLVAIDSYTATYATFAQREFYITGLTSIIRKLNERVNELQKTQRTIAEKYGYFYGVQDAMKLDETKKTIKGEKSDEKTRQC